MDEMTQNAAPVTVVDEVARFRAFTALALAVVALTGGGVVASALQWLVLDRMEGSGDATYLMVLGGAPLGLGVVAAYLASTAMSTHDPLARPVARCSLVLTAVAVLAATVLVLATATSM